MATPLTEADALKLERQRVAGVTQRYGAPARPVAVHALTKPRRSYTPYGRAREVWESTEPRIVYAGPADTGKTMCLLHLLDQLCWTHKGLRAAIVRKVRADMPGTVLQTWERKVLGMPDGEADAPGGVHKHGGESAAFYQYPTNSRVWIAGLDRPGKVLSGELDVVVVNQAEELDVEDWGTLTTRTSGRAGVLRPGRLLADANPGPSTHWIKEQEREGTLRFVESRHRDNPDLYDQATGQMTEEGRRRLDALDKLPGVLRDRLYLGLWKSAEGTVFQPFHVEDAPYAPINYFIGGVDWGYSNPGCLVVYGVDGDDRLYRFCQWYETHVAVESRNPDDDTWVRRAQALQERYNCVSWQCDPARPEFIAAFQSAGLPAIGADNNILQGIQYIEARQRKAGDGLPRIVLLRGSRGPVDETLKKAHKPTCLEEEAEVYVYPKDPASGKTVKENPVDANNHEADATRYIVNSIDGASGFFFG